MVGSWKPVEVDSRSVTNGHRRSLGVSSRAKGSNDARRNDFHSRENGGMISFSSSHGTARENLSRYWREIQQVFFSQLQLSRVVFFVAKVLYCTEVEKSGAELKTPIPTAFSSVYIQVRQAGGLFSPVWKSTILNMRGDIPNTTRPIPSPRGKRLSVFIRNTKQKCSVHSDMYFLVSGLVVCGVF